MQNNTLSEIYEEFKSVLEELSLILKSEFSEDHEEDDKERLKYFEELLQNIDPNFKPRELG